MIIDNNLKMADAQVVTVSAASTVIDAGKAGDAYKPLTLVVDCDADATAAGAATVVVTLETHADKDFGAVTTLFTSKAFSLAEMVAGARLVKIPVPAGMEKCLRTYFTVATGPLLTGKFSAYLTPEAGL